MPYRVEARTRRRGKMTWGPYATEQGALRALLDRRGTLKTVDDRTWMVVPVAAELDEDLRALKVALFDPQEAQYIRGPLHLIGPRLRWEPDLFDRMMRPEQFVNAIGEHAGIWWLLGDRSLGDDASDVVRDGFRFAVTPERLVFLRALGDEQPGLHDPRYRERHSVGGRSVDVLAAPELFVDIFPELTTADHARLALDYHGQHAMALAKWHAAVARATREHGADPFAFRVAGLQKDWPGGHVFAILRFARAATDLLDAARAHWEASEVNRRPPWEPYRPPRGRSTKVTP